MDGAKEGWDDLKATWQEARRCRQDTVRIASLNAEEMRHGGAAGSVADSSDLSDWYPTMAMATRKLVVGFDHDVSRVLMDSSELVGESDVENWPVWRCKVQKPGALEIKRNQAKIFAGPDRILIKYTTNILKNQLSLVLHPHEILGAELIEVQHKRQSSDAGRDRGKNDLRSNWESLFSKPNKKFVVVMHVLTVPSVMDPEAGVSSYQEFEISSFRDANGTILPDKQHLEQACKLRDAIKLVASERAPLLQYARPLRVIVNPISGHRKGRELFGRVEHLFKKADVPMETTFTSYAGHARMIILGGEHEGKRVPPLSPRSYCGVLVIGGDGTVCEVVNAMLEREDWEELVESLPVGTIPAGSECAFAKMISFVDPLGAAWVLLKGHRVGPVDMLRVTQGSRILYCLCGIGWGIPGKLAEESEALREVYGPARYLVSGLRSFLELRGCEGRLEILTPKEEEEEEFSETCRFAGVCKACEASKWRDEGGGEGGGGEVWEEIAGPFVLVGILKSSKKIAPLVHVADGLIDVVAVQYANVGELESRLQLLNQTRKVLSKKQRELCKTDETFHYRKARAIRLAPQNPADKINVDGEVLDGHEIEVRVLPSLLNTFMAYHPSC